MLKLLDTITLKCFDDTRLSWDLASAMSPLIHQQVLDDEKTHEMSTLKDFLNSTIIMNPWPETIMDHLNTMTLDNLVKRLPFFMNIIDSLIDLVDDSIAMPSSIQHIFDSAIALKDKIAKKYLNIIKIDVLKSTKPPKLNFDVLDHFTLIAVNAMVFLGAVKELENKSREAAATENPQDYQKRQFDEDILHKAGQFDILWSHTQYLKTQLNKAKEARDHCQNQEIPEQKINGDTLLDDELQELLDDLRNERSQHLSTAKQLEEVESSHSDQYSVGDNQSRTGSDQIRTGRNPK